MYNHILIPTDGSELSKMAIYEGVALAKALGARVTVVTVTTPFHVLTADPGMVTDTPAQYKEHMAAVAVESRMGAVAWGLWPSLRFPSPLIEPDVPVSGIRLSDWFHRMAHDGSVSGRRSRRRSPRSP